MSKGGTIGSNLNSKGKRNKYYYLIVHKIFHSLIVLWDIKKLACEKSQDWTRNGNGNAQPMDGKSHVASACVLC